MYDLEFHLENRPGALAELGEAMGRTEVPFEGGGMFSSGERATAHFLFRDGEVAAQAARAAGITVVAIRKPLIRKPLIRKLKQGTPGQLGAISRALADAGANILVQYSDHHNRLVLICDNDELAQNATMSWTESE